MAYQTGIINSFYELKTILSTVLPANGWTEEVNGDRSVFKSGKCHALVEVVNRSFFEQPYVNMSYSEFFTKPGFEQYYVSTGWDWDVSSARSYRAALIGWLPLNIEFDGIPEQAITLTWIPDQGSRYNSKFSVVGSVSGAFPDWETSVSGGPTYSGSYDQGGLSFQRSTLSPYSTNYYTYLNERNNWLDENTPPGLYVPAPADQEQNQLMLFYPGHKSDGAGTLTGVSDATSGQRNEYYHNGGKGFNSRPVDRYYSSPEYDQPTSNIFPARYHLHALTDPNEVWLIVEDNRHQVTGTSVRNTWIGFGETVSSGDGFYMNASLGYSSHAGNSPKADNLDDPDRNYDNYPFVFGQTSPQSYPKSNTMFWGASVQGYEHRHLIPFGSYRGVVLYDPVIGDRYRFFDGYDSSYLSPTKVALQASSYGASHLRDDYGGNESKILNQPLLQPISFEVLDSTSGGIREYRRMATSSVAGVRKVSMEHVANGEVISDGVNNWKCYVGYEQSPVRTGQTFEAGSGNYGFAIRYDGP